MPCWRGRWEKKTTSNNGVLRNSSAVLRERACSRASRLFLYVAHFTLAELLGILRRPDVVILSPVLEHMVNGARDLVGRGHERLGRTKPPFEAAGARATGTMRAAH